MSRVDVAVVGGGIIGASIAWRLAQRGIKVEVFEAGRIGGEASWAGAGMLAPGSEIASRGGWTGLAMESLAGYPQFVGELTEESRELIDYRVSGALEVAFDEEDWTLLRERAAAQRELGIASEQVSPHGSELRRVSIDGSRLAGALYYPADGMVDPRDVMRALGAALNWRGIRVREQCRVKEVRPSERGVTLNLAEGTCEAGAAVLAAGAWSSSLARSIPESLPVRGHLIGWRMQAGSIGPIVRHHHTYILQRGNGFTIAGTSEERVGFDRSLDQATVTAIAGRARALLPMLPAREPDEAWLGFRPGTVSGEPAIGRLGGTRLWLAYGHYRNGILMAPATARRIADEIISS